MSRPSAKRELHAVSTLATTSWLPRLGARLGSVAFAIVSSLIFAASVSSAQSNAAATQREVQFMLGAGYGWGHHDAVNPFGIGVFLHAGYTALGGAYVGIMGDAYSGESREQADGRTERAMIGLGAELGYDLRLSERWTLRFSLLNVAGALETIQCRQLAPPPSQQTCSEPAYGWRYGVGPSLQAVYLWEKAAFFSELRQTSYLGSSGAIFSATAVIGFGSHF